ncbi:cupin domain-containing protein [Paenibacillus sp. HB172176]|uniref:cupin domain-containing protein n=1 Tax=Paenibacillus sp. HB172176 TaxID=2493690 RepID=UPI00143B4559|nr:cupin domain-containing protein [Paenibacillus sp. HB172176]
MDHESIDYASPSVQFTYNLNNNLLFKKNNQNYITSLNKQQLNTLRGTALLDIYLSQSNTVEPHYHQNATELIYCITGSAIVSIINPFTNKLLHFKAMPSQVVNIPQGWWHYIIALQDDTHLLAIFDNAMAGVIFGSDILRLTPPKVLAHTYCLNEEMVKETLAPIQETVFIGPPNSCKTAAAGISTNTQSNAGQMPSMQGNMPTNGMGQQGFIGGEYRPSQLQHFGASYQAHADQPGQQQAPEQMPYVPFLYRRWD